jgi:hypothetical protein
MQLRRQMLGILQLAGTLVIVAFLPSNPGKAVALLGWWALTFGRLSRAEWALFAGGSALFTLLDAAAIRQRAFSFASPDFLGLPWWEPLMWGFYLLHARRMVGAAEADGRGRPGLAAALALVFSAAFMASTDSGLRFAVTAVALAGALGFFHSRRDLLGAGYMVLLGAAVEYAGVWSGQWSYADAPAGGVPLWFATMWGAVGLFLGRLAGPLAERAAGSAALPAEGEVVGARRGVGFDLGDEALGDQGAQVAGGRLA